MLATSKPPNWLPFDDEPSSIVDRPSSIVHRPSATIDDGRLTIDDLPDSAARARAVDPAHNVVLEASAGTGKTHVLVDRYLNLLSRGVEPVNILAITFTRKAAAEMRGRILTELRKRADASGADQKLWREMRERSGDIAISTIDAFCLALLREFPLEANLDPGFEMADETQVPRLMEEALDRALDIGRGLARTDDYVRLLFAELREQRLRDGLANMIDRRLVVDDAIDRALAAGPRDLTAQRACEDAFERLRGVFTGLTGGTEGFLANGPIHHRRWAIFSGGMRVLASGTVPPPGLTRGVLDRIENHFLNKEKQPRQRFDGYSAKDCRSADAWKIHRHDVLGVGAEVANVLKSFRRDLNAVLSRAVRRVYQIALREYRETLDAHGVLDFSETLAQSLSLLAQMDEFARSRYRLEGRYHHVLLDEFQDTSRAQWTLVALLIRSWAEGSGIAEGALAPSIFLVGDRKQSIYGFRDADVAVMDEAGAFVDGLRPDHDSRRAISKSFRAVPQLLAFSNDVFGEIEKDEQRRDAFRFAEQDTFPVEHPIAAGDALGIVVAPSVAEHAEAVAVEIRRLLDTQTLVRDPATREPRPITPRDVGILFRTKDSHQDFEKALERHRIPSYVYKGLGFFEADEIKDVLALLRYLASPESNLRAAAFLRSRFVRLSDPALQVLAPNLAPALSARAVDLASLDREDRLVLEQARLSVARWLGLVDRLPPAEVLELVLDETAYMFETQGARARQARENLKKIRAMIRRVQNGGYATMARLAEHLERLTAGDESNAVIDAGDSVSLMTIHAAKGLEFPVVFVVNLSRGTGGRRPAIRVVSDAEHGQAWLSVGDFQSEADADAKAKDREETKRLLYVALTRARDRLYLASEIKDARWRAFGGSLGDILPPGVKARFEAASMSPPPETTAWTAASGLVHTFRVCASSSIVDRPSSIVGDPLRSIDSDRRLTIDDGRVADNFEPLIDPFELPRVAVTRGLAPAEGKRRRNSMDSTSRSLTGTLVHRLFERFGISLAGETSPQAIADALACLIRDEEIIEAGDVEDVFNRARSAYLALCGQRALAQALESGDALFEVPFSVRPASSHVILRGTFDCLIQRRDGSGITVLELKTGKPAPEHDEQLQVYLTAARAMYPGMLVEGKLVYAKNLDDRSLDSNV
ncbi:MAG TPA: UvrD-helicase domain-containing protein [Vicinamibacterales bacterium]|nr:UvrD-helicase domain-containing protein [Vicinamibacterales bacterium]